MINGKKFIYQEKELYHGRKIINKKTALENLKIFVDIIQSTKIRYGLIYGTLLGAIRENDFISHDEDIDIFVLEEDKEIFFDLLERYRNMGLDVVRYVENTMSLMRNDDYIDIYFFRKKTNYLIKNKRILNGIYKIDSDYLEKTQKIDFLGLSVPVPEKSERLLQSIYGKDWKIPKINSHAQPNVLHVLIGQKLSFIKSVPLLYSLALKLKKYIIKE